MTQDDIRLRLQVIRKRMAQAAERVGRDPSDIALLAASKQVGLETILRAIDSGIEHVGENQVQEAEAKFKDSEPAQRPFTLQLIGSLQANKVRRALQLFSVIQSVDTLSLARRMNNIARELDRQVPVYIQVNVGSEPTKSGVKPDQLIELAGSVAECENLGLTGLMAVPPDLADPEAVRPYFRMLRELRDSLYRIEPFHDSSLGLSMGMSHDFEVAIEEGATMVRLGRVIWEGAPLDTP